jgi:hypothetical protein
MKVRRRKVYACWAVSTVDAFLQFLVLRFLSVALLLLYLLWTGLRCVGQLWAAHSVKSPSWVFRYVYGFPLVTPFFLSPSSCQRQSHH